VADDLKKRTLSPDAGALFLLSIFPEHGVPASLNTPPSRPMASNALAQTAQLHFDSNNGCLGAGRKAHRVLWKAVMIGPGTWRSPSYVACVSRTCARACWSCCADRISCAKADAVRVLFSLSQAQGDRLKLLYWDGQGFCLLISPERGGSLPAMTGGAQLTVRAACMLWGRH